MLDSPSSQRLTYVRIADVADINPRTGVSLAADAMVPFVPMAAVSGTTAAIEAEEKRRFAEVSKGYTIFRDGDVIVAKITPCFENNKIAHARLSGPIGFGSTEFHVIRARPDSLDARYILHFLRQDHVREEGERKMTGSAGQRRVPAQVLAKLVVPLPPLDEQRRIAAILDEADALRVKRRAALAQLDEMAQAIFVEMFGDTVSNSRGWDAEHTLGALADIASGITKGRKAPASPLRPVPYLAVSNVQDRALDLRNVKQIEASADEIRRYRLQANDLVLTEGGDPDKLGRGVLWHEEIDECIHQNHIFRVRVTSDSLHPVFLSWIISSPRGKDYFLRSAKQTTGIASINMGQLKAFPLLLPPRALQDEFDDRLHHHERLKRQALASLATLDTLFASLQHRAFRGEL
ncbi:MAG: restriction endonuclease subunit S [Roseomonas sp.]|nr:restriction endonuclease subunit S [Roseomonas sp.]